MEFSTVTNCSKIKTAPDNEVASDRFNYEYSDVELQELAGHVRDLQARDIHIVFNNNHEDQAQRNARTLRSMMGA